MELRYGIIDENVRKRSVLDIILHERQSFKQAVKTPALIGIEGTLALMRAVNEQAARGLRALSFEPRILLPPGTEEETLRDLYRQICRAGFPLGLEIGGGYAEVTDAVTRPVVTGTVTGIPFQSAQDAGNISDFSKVPDTSNISDYQIIRASCDRKPPEACAGMDIVAAGQVGLEGSWILVHSCRDQLRDRFQESLLIRLQELTQQMCILRAAETAASSKAAAASSMAAAASSMAAAADSSGASSATAAVMAVSAETAASAASSVAAGAGQMVSLSGGGFFAGLWELSKRTACGMIIDLPLVPILQETIEITNYLEINPYLMRSAGCLLIAAPDGKSMAEALQAADIPAVCIGTLQDSNDKIIRNGEELRSLDRPQTDALDLYLHRHRPGG